MSVLLYASLTGKRETSPALASTSTAPPGVKTALDALAALVPAELLGLHALALALFTETEGEGDGAQWIITEKGALQGAFLALVILAPVLYFIGHKSKWQPEDWIRCLIPAAAFVGWTMVQENTAFDAWFDWEAAVRFFIPAVAAVVLGALAARLGSKADSDPPPAP